MNTNVSWDQVCFLLLEHIQYTGVLHFGNAKERSSKYEQYYFFTFDPVIIKAVTKSETIPILPSLGRGHGLRLTMLM